MRKQITVGIACAVVALTLVARPATADPQGDEVTMKGEVIDLWCYLEGGDHGAEHKACAVTCAKAGNPIGVLDAKGNVYVAMGIKDHQPGREVLIDKMADTVTVTGTLVKKGGVQVIYVKSVKQTKMMTRVFALTLVIAASSLAAEPAMLRLAQIIPLPGVEGRIDHLTADVAGQRLFIAALGNGTVEVVDLKAGQRVQSLTGLHEPQGVAWVPETGQLFVASGQDGTVKVFDGKSYRLTSALEGLDDADNVRYDAHTKRVYVGYGTGALAVIDASRAKHVGDIKLAGHPESFQLDHNGQRIFVNVPTAKQLAVADREKQTVIATWPVEQAAANFPMALADRLYVACRKPPTLLALNGGSGQTVASIPIDSDADDVFFDAKRQRLYVSCGAGFLDVLDAGNFKMLERLPTASGARTSLFVSELNKLYLAVPQRGSQPAEVRVYEASAFSEK